MAIKERAVVRGVPTLRLIGPDGVEKERRVCENMIVDSGLEMIAGHFVDPNAAIPGYMGIGEGSTAPTETNTGLEAEVGDRKAFTNSFVETADEISAVFVGLFEEGESTGAITEAGLFVDATGGVMTNRVVFPVINKQAADNLEISWRLTFTAA